MIKPTAPPQQAAFESRIEPNINHVNIRVARRGDEQEIQRLYREGALSGVVHAADLVSDIQFPESVYFGSDRGRMWVADAGEHLVAMIAVMHDREDVGTIHRLRIERPWRETDIITRMLRPVFAYCRDKGYLKIIFDTEAAGPDTSRLFEQQGLGRSRRHDHDARELVEFYVDLYQPPAKGDHRETGRRKSRKW